MTKPIPTFPGFRVGPEERREYARNGQLFRLGIKMNTPEFCNWQCPYCYAGNTVAKDRPRLLKTDELAGDKLHRDESWPERMKSWIDQALKFGLKAVTLNGQFEPTMSPHLMEIVGYCRSQGLLVTLVTNGRLLNRELLEQLNAHDVFVLTKINVPMVEPNDPRYDEFANLQRQLSGVSGQASKIYEMQKEVVRGLIEAGFGEAGEPGKTRMGVESVITTSNMPYLPELVAQLRAANVYCHIEVTKLQGFAKNNRHLIPTYEAVRELFENILQQDIQSGYEAWEPHPPYVAAACHENLFRLDFHANGTVKPCPGIETTLGNLNEVPLSEILQHPTIAILRRLDQTIQGDCRDCRLFQDGSCLAGCRGTTYQVLKSRGFSDFDAWTGSDPSCWRVTKVLDDGTTVSDLNVFSHVN